MAVSETDPVARERGSRTADIAVKAIASVSPEQALGAATDFTERRARIWQNVTVKRLEIHEA
jgi:hypothetical protein